jgi:hypothetical protein
MNEGFFSMHSGQNSNIPSVSNIQQALALTGTAFPDAYSMLLNHNEFTPELYKQAAIMSLESVCGENPAQEIRIFNIDHLSAIFRELGNKSPHRAELNLDWAFNIKGMTGEDQKHLFPAILRKVLADPNIETINLRNLRPSSTYMNLTFRDLLRASRPIQIRTNWELDWNSVSKLINLLNHNPAILRFDILRNNQVADDLWAHYEQALLRNQQLYKKIDDLDRIAYQLPQRCYKNELAAINTLLDRTNKKVAPPTFSLKNLILFSKKNDDFRFQFSNMQLRQLPDELQKACTQREQRSWNRLLR